MSMEDFSYLYEKIFCLGKSIEIYFKNELNTTLSHHNFTFQISMLSDSKIENSDIAFWAFDDMYIRNYHLK